MVMADTVEALCIKGSVWLQLANNTIAPVGQLVLSNTGSISEDLSRPILLVPDLETCSSRNYQGDADAGGTEHACGHTLIVLGSVVGNNRCNPSHGFSTLPEWYCRGADGSASRRPVDDAATSSITCFSALDPNSTGQ